MPRPLLLFLDSESPRTPGLASALEVDGWAVRCAHGTKIPEFLQSGLTPGLLLLDLAAPGEAGRTLARVLRQRHPRLAVVALSEDTAPPTDGRGHVLDIQAYLDPAQTDGALVTALRSYLPEAAKRPSEDLFGDLLADLDTPPPVPPLDPFALFDPALHSPSSQTPVSLGHLLGGGPDETSTLAIPDRRRLSVPSVKVPPVLRPGGSLFATTEPAKPPAEPEFAFSSISGLEDPFGWSMELVPAPPAPNPPPRPPVSGDHEEYGNYFLLEKIAVGGMAELFKAQQRGVQGFQKIVAIKRILPHFSDNEDFVTMFIDEAKLAAQLTHPNIVQIFDLGKAGSSYYIAMEYVNGRDLRTLLKKVREHGLPFPEQVAAFVVMKVAAALDYAHRKRGFDDRELKLVHRDISPQNVILSTDGAVKLVDFGIAKAASKASHTLAGALKGKLLYMSPEQATGQPLDNRSDLYSLGLVLFELLTGERCFQADSELGVLDKVRQGRIADLATLNPTVSRDMAAIVARALQKGVDHRYPSARFMERDLRDYLQRLATPLTEHDVADYLQVLLKGTREELQTLIAQRFPVPADPASGGHRIVGEGSNAPAALPRSEPLPPEPEADRPTQADPPLRPRWLLPVILALGVLLGVLLAVARWS
jgi:serine/threonine protein kinase/CheY-like chemotaxis protein